MSLLTALGYAMSGYGEGKRQRRADEAQNAYQQQTLGMERERNAEQKRLDDAQLRSYGINPDTGQYYPFTANTQVRPNNHGQVRPEDSDPATLAANARRLAGEAIRANRPDLAKQYSDLATSYDTGAVKQSTVGLNKAKVDLEQAQALYTRNRLGVSLQEATIRAQAAMYGADQHLRGSIAQADAHIQAAGLSAQASEFGHVVAANALIQGHTIDQATKLGVEAGRETENYLAAQGKSTGNWGALPPLPLTPQQPQSLGDELQSLRNAGFQIQPLPIGGGSIGDSGGSLAPQFVAAMQQAGQKWGVDPSLLQRVAMAESGGNPNTQPSPAGAVGLMQFMPATARGFGFDPRDPIASINGAAQYLSQLTKKNGGDQTLALVEYNGGQPAVDAWKAGKPFRESTAYVQKIMGGGTKPTPSPSQAPKPAPKQADQNEPLVVKSALDYYDKNFRGKPLQEAWQNLSGFLTQAGATPEELRAARVALEQHIPPSPRGKDEVAAQAPVPQAKQQNRVAIPSPAGLAAARKFIQQGIAQGAPLSEELLTWKLQAEPTFLPEHQARTDARAALASTHHKDQSATAMTAKKLDPLAVQLGSSPEAIRAAASARARVAGMMGGTGAGW